MDWRRETALESFGGLEPDMWTWAPCSRAASATQKPMPDVPPMTSTRALCNLFVYLRVVGAISFQRRMECAVIRLHVIYDPLALRIEVLRTLQEVKLD